MLVRALIRPLNRKLRSGWRVATLLAACALAAAPAPAEAQPASPPSAAAAAQEADRLTADTLRLAAQGNIDAALPLAERALALREKALGSAHADTAVAAYNVGELHARKFDLKNAEIFYLRAISIWEKALGPDHVDIATVLGALADLYRAKAELGRAEPLLQRAIPILEKSFGRDHPEVAAPLGVLGGVYLLRGDTERAEPVLQRAISILEKALGPGAPDLASPLTTLAQVLTWSGDSVRAEALFLRALPLWEKRSGPESGDVAAVLYQLGGLAERRGDIVRAEALLVRSLALAEKVLGPEHVHVAIALTGLADLYDLKNEHERAEPLAARALAIQEKTLGPAHPDVADSLQTLARLAQVRRDDKAAEALYLRALGVLEKAHGPDHPRAASCRGDLASLYHEMGDAERAEPQYRRSIAIYEKASGPEHPYVAALLNNLANLQLSRGRAPDAVTLRARGAAIQDHHAAILLAIGSEEQKRAYMSTLQWDTGATVSLHVRSLPDDRGAARLALTTILRRKGRVLDAMTDGFAALRLQESADVRALLDKLFSVNTRLAALIARGPGDTPLDRHRAAVSALEAERQALEVEASAKSAVFRAEQRPVTIPEVQAAIPEGAALVEIVVYRPFLVRAAARSQLMGPPRYVAYVLHRSGEASFVDLGEAAPIDAAVKRLRVALADPAADPKPPARDVYSLVMQPIGRLIGGSRSVLVSPDGALSLVPFGALVDEGGRYLIERLSFTYLTSGRDLLRIRGTAPPREGPMVVGDPAFGDFGASPYAKQKGRRSIDMGKIEFSKLDGTAAEAREVGRMLVGARVLTGARSTESAIKALHAPYLLHIATHGFFLPNRDDPPPGAASGRAEDRAAAASVRIESPMLRAGLAFAGANERASGAEDGVLTALEASGLDLHGTKLVVLSACETGVGDASAGDGVHGLRRALVIAGAETQVMSLWRVDDEGTRHLMVDYYTRLSSGEGRSEAMRGAALAMAHTKETAHPYYWASFIVSGSGAPLDAKRADHIVPKVDPGPRGCACAAPGGEGPGSQGGAAVALVAASLAAALRWKRARRAILESAA